MYTVQHNIEVTYKDLYEAQQLYKSAKAVESALYLAESPHYWEAMKTAVLASLRLQQVVVMLGYPADSWDSLAEVSEERAYNPESTPDRKLPAKPEWVI